MPPKDTSDQMSSLGTWVEWARYIFSELKRLDLQAAALDNKLHGIVEELYLKIEKEASKADTNISEEIALIRPEVAAMRTEIAAVQLQLATLRTKASLWGAAAGAIPVLITLLISFVVYLITKQLP